MAKIVIKPHNFEVICGLNDWLWADHIPRIFWSFSLPLKKIEIMSRFLNISKSETKICISDLFVRRAVSMISQTIRTFYVQCTVHIACTSILLSLQQLESSMQHQSQTLFVSIRDICAWLLCKSAILGYFFLFGRLFFFSNGNDDDAKEREEKVGQLNDYTLNINDKLYVFTAFNIE